MNSVENNGVEITECYLAVIYFPFNLLLSECFINYFTYKNRLRVLGLFGLEKVLGRPQSTFQQLKRSYKKGGERLFTRSCCDRTSDEDFELKGGLCYVRYQEEIFYCEGGEALEQVSQGNCECPIPGSPGRPGWMGPCATNLIQSKIPLPMEEGFEANNF